MFSVNKGDSSDQYKKYFHYVRIIFTKYRLNVIPVI